MQLKPKYTRSSLIKMNNKYGKKNARHFTGRTASMQELSDAMERKSMQNYTVIHFYGIGGIGKTRLQKEMMSDIEKSNNDIIIGHLNFEASHLLSAQGALAELREQIKNTYKLQFDWFDLACAVLWKKVNPTITFEANQKELPFLDESNYVTELISLVDGLPFVQWVPKTMQFAHNISIHIKRRRMSTDELSVLVKELVELEPFEIEERLPFFFAEDIRRFLKTRSKRPIIFIDTYEAISNNNRHQESFNDKDGWVKELVLQLPEVLWVFFGREKLEWEREHSDWSKIINQTQMDPFSEAEAEEFLMKAGIADKEIRKKMIHVSDGLPYHLDLSVDTFELIKERKVPEIVDFSSSSNHIVERLIRYLSLSERELLKVLSFPQHWNEALFKNLITSFSIGYPATAIDEISRFSFVVKTKNDKWEMHPIMRRSFQRMMKEDDPSFYTKVHQLLFMEYGKLLARSQQSLNTVLESYLNEMAFHATEFEMSDSEEKSLMTALYRFYKAGYYRVFTPLSTDLQRALNSFASPFSIAKMNAMNGYVAADQGRLDIALEHFELAEQQLLMVSPEEHGYYNLSIRIKREAASIHIKRTAYNQARQLLVEASSLKPEFDSQNLQLVHVFLQLGKLENDSSNKEKAGICYQNGFELIESVIQKEADNAEALCLKGILYEKKGEWLTSNRLHEQTEAYKCAIECFDQAISQSEKLPLELEVARGLAWKRLAENYSKQDELQADTIHAFQTAISIYDGLLAENNDFVEALVKKGHAAVDYLTFLGKCTLYDEAEAIFELAIDSFSLAIEKSIDQAAAHNRIASAYREMAIIYYLTGKEKMAIATFAKAIEESHLLSHRYPNYIHADSTLRKIRSAMEKTGLPFNQEYAW